MLSRATTETAAANGGLALIGEPAIADLSGRKTAAIVVRSRFAGVRDALLSDHDWNFADEWVRPAADPSLNTGLFTFAYPMPSDCLIIREVETLDNDEWDIGATREGLKLLRTNLPAPHVRYTSIVPVERWSAHFLEIFELRLAVAIAPSLGRNAAKARSDLALAELRLPKARRIDSQEKSSRETSRNTSWLRARL